MSHRSVEQLTGRVHRLEDLCAFLLKRVDPEVLLELKHPDEQKNETDSMVIDYQNPYASPRAVIQCKPDTSSVSQPWPCVPSGQTIPGNSAVNFSAEPSVVQIPAPLTPTLTPSNTNVKLPKKAKAFIEYCESLGQPSDGPYKIPISQAEIIAKEIETKAHKTNAGRPPGAKASPRSAYDRLHDSLVKEGLKRDTEDSLFVYRKQPSN